MLRRRRCLHLTYYVMMVNTACLSIAVICIHNPMHNANFTSIRHFVSQLFVFGRSIFLFCVWYTVYSNLIYKGGRSRSAVFFFFFFKTCLTQATNEIASMPPGYCPYKNEACSLLAYDRGYTFSRL